MAYILFVLTGLFLLYLIALRKRVFDFISVFCVALNVYYLPLYFGVVKSSLSATYVKPVPEVFVCFVIVNLVFSAAVIVNDLIVEKRCSNRIIRGRLSLIDGGSDVIHFTFLYVLFFLFILSFYVSVEFYYVVRNISSALMIILTASLVLYRGRILIFLLFFIHLFLIIFMHDRSTSVLSILAFFVLYSFKNISPFVLFRSRYFLLMIFGVMIFSLFKPLYSLVSVYGLVGGFVETWQRLNVKFLFAGLEGQYTQFILDRVIYHGFQIDSSFMIASFIKLLPLPSVMFGIGSTTFNDLFQSKLFPSIEYGMAANPWAESYSWGGLPGVLVMSIFYASIICGLNFYCKASVNNIIRIVIAVVATYFAFWMHRNSLGSVLSHVRNGIYVFALSYILSQAVKDFVFVKRIN